MAVSCGTPMPATMRVVQMEPGADLDGVGAGVDQRHGALVGGHVAGDDLHPVRLALQSLDRARHVDGVAVGGIDHHHIDPGLDQGHGAFIAIVAGGGGRADQQPALGILGRVRVGLGLVHVLDGDQADGAIIVVHDDQPLDFPLLQKGSRL
jgi:hypothetical protein